ncbi:MAG TPA: hypothetical protein VIN37_02885 [Candidatus Limnocylindria bacterium]
MSDGEIGLKPQADDPITTTVRTPTYDHGETCAHGRRWVSVDGERWHLVPRLSVSVRWPAYVPCDPEVELLPKRKGAR